MKLHFLLSNDINGRENSEIVERLLLEEETRDRLFLIRRLQRLLGGVDAAEAWDAWNDLGPKIEACISDPSSASLPFSIAGFFVAFEKARIALDEEPQLSLQLSTLALRIAENLNFTSPPGTVLFPGGKNHLIALAGSLCGAARSTDGDWKGGLEDAKAAMKLRGGEYLPDISQYAAISYSRAREHHVAIELLKAAIAGYERTQRNFRKGCALLHLAVVFRRSKGAPAESLLEILDQAEMLIGTREPRKSQTVGINRATVLLQEERFADCLQTLDDVGRPSTWRIAASRHWLRGLVHKSLVENSSASTHLSQALQVYREKDQENAVMVSVPLAATRLNLGQLEAGRDLITWALPLADQLGLHTEREQLLALLQHAKQAKA